MAFCINIFEYRQDISNVFPPVINTEEFILNFNWNVYAMVVEFIPTHKDTNNTVLQRITNITTLGLNSKMQSKTLCFSLTIKRILQWA